MRLENSPGEQLQALAQIGSMAAQSREAAIKAEQTRIAALSERFRQAQVLQNENQMRSAANEMGGNYDYMRNDNATASIDKSAKSQSPSMEAKTPMLSIAEKAKQQADQLDPQTKSRLFADIANQIQDLSNPNYKPQMSAPQSEIDKISAVASGNNVNPFVSNNDKMWTPDEFATMKEQKGLAQIKLATDRNKMNANPNDKAYYESQMNKEAAANVDKRTAEALPQMQQAEAKAVSQIKSSVNRNTAQGQLQLAREEFSRNGGFSNPEAILDLESKWNAIYRKFDIKDQGKDLMKFMVQRGTGTPHLIAMQVIDSKGGIHEVSIPGTSVNRSSDAMEVAKKDPRLKGLTFTRALASSPSTQAGQAEKDAKDFRAQLLLDYPKASNTFKNGLAYIVPFMDTNAEKVKQFNDKYSSYGAEIGDDGTVIVKDWAPEYVKLVFNKGLANPGRESFANTSKGKIE